MADFDVFNGDADGILSLVQLRRAAPKPGAALVTGRKRDIKLLGRVDASSGDNVTVLDISMHSNMTDLRRILDAGANVLYIDHHNAGDLPQHPNLDAIIDTTPEMCTAMLVDTRLEGAYRAWAVTAAFGDNFPKLARQNASGLDLPLERLERLGILINYNGYGASVDDLHFHPADLYRQLARFDTPMEFLDDSLSIFEKLDTGYEEDMQFVKNGETLSETEFCHITLLPNDARSRRASGVYGNKLAQDFQNRAHAILTANDKGGYVVSVRAPLLRRTGADTLCLTFETGGGRAAAAGINHLPETDLERFRAAFSKAFKP